MLPTNPFVLSVALWTSFVLVFLGAKADPAIGGRGKPLQLTPRDPCPGTYDFGLGTLHIVHHRSIKKDSVYIAASVVVNDTGRLSSYNITKFYGKHGNGKFQTNITFQDIRVADSASAVLGYVIFNIGHGSQKDVMLKLQNAAYEIALKGTTAAAARPTKNIGEILLVDLVEYLLRQLGTFIKAITEIIEAGIHGCDGWTGAGVHAFRGSGICSNQATNKNNLTGTDRHKGNLKTTLPGIICSLTTSQYNIGWFAGSKGGIGNFTLLESLNNAPLAVGTTGGVWMLVIAVGGFLALL